MFSLNRLLGNKPNSLIADELITRQAEIDSFSENGDQRRFVAVLSSDTPVTRTTRDGIEYDEILIHDDHSIDLSRMPLPVFVGHEPIVDEKKRGMLNIGLVDRVWLENGRALGEVQLGQNATATAIWPDIKSKIVRYVSVTYKILPDSHVDNSGDRPKLMARWKPYETSIVGLPEDHNAQILATRSLETIPMEKSTFDIKSIQSRQAEVAKVFEYFPKYADLKARCLQEFVTVEQARTLLLDEMGKEVDEPDPNTRVANLDLVGPYGDRRFGGYGATHFRAAAVDGLLLREGVSVEKPHAGAADFRHCSLPQIAELCLRASNESTVGLSNAQLVSRALSTSDFPYLMADVMNKSLMSSFEVEPASHRVWTGVGTANDFRDLYKIRKSEVSPMEEVQEYGEYPLAQVFDSQESYRVRRYGQTFRISYEAMVNDDLGAFSRVPSAFGASAARLESDIVYNLLTSNPDMSDGTPLFDDANHGNYLTGSGSQLTDVNLGIARAKQRRQKGPTGQILNIVPTYLIVPAELENTGLSLLNAVMVATQETANISREQLNWIRNLILVVEARLDENSTTAWYLASSFEQCETIERSYLNGEQVAVEQERRFSDDSLASRARFEIGAGVLDWRGLLKADGLP